ncbi:MAG: hypothetical protein IIA03_06785 [Proteobacteria bacterium]|nr:hypothetical protein [Pseudomonadota bacterium]
MLFSDSQSSGATDPSDDGDDTLLVMSFNDFKSAMSGYGINLEAICDDEMPSCP